MKLSVVIPTYNMASLLREGLSYLAAQQLVPGLEFEVIVIDDGSADDTRGVVEAFTGRLPSLSYHFLPRGPRSCRAAARNRGIEVAQGELLTFLDSGLALSPRFLSAVSQQLSQAPRRMLIHPVYGLVARYGTKYGSDVSALASLTPESFDAACEQLRRLPEWDDPREGYFQLCGDRLEQLKAPWMLGWTTAVSLPRALAREAGGFDADFLGWGMEDIDFSYRLHLGGASFAVAREAPVVHLPHPPLSSTADKQRSHDANVLRMHRKHRTRETEVCLLFSGPHLNHALARLDDLVIQGVGPRYAVDMLQALAASHLAGPGPSLAVGVDGFAEACHLPVTHMLAPHHTLRARLAEQFPERTVECLLGIDTPFPDGFFEVAVVTDFLRMFPEATARRMARELVRIARKVVLLCTPGAEMYLSQDGQPWASLEALESSLQAEGLRWEELLVQGDHTLIALSSLQEHAP
ncbi:glycosyltransferase family 2 protein [Hyalangium sp.]|uniref:glycosyltransferase family 2 protein n=1 Tax=Hyalangium sp. TaxID=2028555 RepID=UPI002D7276AE|nr:glycosyltransferase [Hyalangium sp.]HYH97947.1 glycosyltransferase [Hyalangium sp.]